MKIGAMSHPARSPLEEIDWFGRHGFDFVDFTLEPPAADPGQIDPGAVRAALDRHGLGVVAHTAWFIPIGSPFGSVREASLVEFRPALRASHQVGATVMNGHYGKSRGFFAKEQVVGWRGEVLSRLCQEAAEVGVTIVSAPTATSWDGWWKRGGTRSSWSSGRAASASAPSCRPSASASCFSRWVFLCSFGAKLEGD